MRHLFPQSSLLAGMLLFFIFPFVNSQELTEAQRKERCEVNNKSLLEYDQKLADLKRIRSNIEKYSILHNDYTALHYAVNHRKLLESYNTMKKRHDAVSEYNMKWNSLWDKNIDAFQKALRDKIGVDLLETSKYTLEAIQEDIQIINGQIEVHEKRIADLHCADFEKEMASKNKNTPENEVQQQGEVQENIVKLQKNDQKNEQQQNQQKETQQNGQKEKQISSGWAGIWEQPGSTVKISGEGGSMSATFDYAAGGGKGTGGAWTGCKVIGDSIKCDWKIKHEDGEKTGSRSGILMVKLDGEKIGGRYVEDKPVWEPKDKKIQPEDIISGMFKGKVWPINMTRKN